MFLCRKLSQWGDIYVNDAFEQLTGPYKPQQSLPNSSRKQMFWKSFSRNYQCKQSIKRKPKACNGPLLEAFKVSSKITIIENILDKVDYLIIGGGMITFIKSLRET
ncbi:MAG: phosphoglycerate kinase [Flavobacteriaceae bacterium]